MLEEEDVEEEDDDDQEEKEEEEEEEETARACVRWVMGARGEGRGGGGPVLAIDAFLKTWRSLAEKSEA